MTNEQKESILDAYDDYCERLPHISVLYANMGALKRMFAKTVQYLSANEGEELVKRHKITKRTIISKASSRNPIDEKEGLEYIDYPDIVVETEIPGQCIECSLENYVYHLPVFEQYIMLPDDYEPSDDISFLDKAVVALTLKLTKAEIAPGVYKVIEEVIPVVKSVYHEMLNKLIRQFIDKIGEYPNEAAMKLLQDKAMVNVCDRRYADGIIGEIDSLEGLREGNLDFSTSYTVGPLEWGKFKRSIEYKYNIEWEDTYKHAKTGKKVRAWRLAGFVSYDNRQLVKAR